LEKGRLLKKKPAQDLKFKEESVRTKVANHICPAGRIVLPDSSSQGIGQRFISSLCDLCGLKRSGREVDYFYRQLPAVTIFGIAVWRSRLFGEAGTRYRKFFSLRPWRLERSGR